MELAKLSRQILILGNIARGINARQHVNCNVGQIATITYFKPDENLKIKWPECNKLKIVPRTPTMKLNMKPRKMQKRLILMRGPESVHNFLLHEQYGIQAVRGGRMAPEHFEHVRKILLKSFDYRRMFAVWRIDPPWQAVSKKGQGKRMGGGKGEIHHYVTPVKAGRIIIEAGGLTNLVEIKKKFATLVNVLPFPTRFVTQKLLQAEAEEEEWKKQNNMNPYTWEYVIMNNIGGCNNWLSPYDYKWFTKYR